jgi:hypothetical protein
MSFLQAYGLGMISAQVGSFFCSDDVLSSLLPWVVRIRGFLFSLYCETGTEDETRTFSLCSGLPRGLYTLIFLFSDSRWRNSRMGHNSTAPWVHGVSSLSCPFCVQKSCVDANKKARAIQQILASSFTFLVLSHWSVDRSA